MTRGVILPGGAAAVAVLVSGEAASVGRVAVALALTCLAPGAIAVRAIGITDRTQALALAIALSLAVTTVIATALMYAGLWSWPACAVLVTAATAGLRFLPDLREER